MAKRVGFIESIPDDDGRLLLDEEQLMAKLERLVVTMGEVGGAAMFGVRRLEVEPGRFENVGVYWLYNTFVPAEHLEALEEDRPEGDPGEEPGEDTVPDAQGELEPEREPAVTLE